jgi:hypothetical protein
MAMDMLKLSMSIKKTTSTNAGNVIQKESFMYMNPKWLQVMMLITVVTILTSSCTEFAVLSSGAGIAVSQSTYAKVYSGIDFLTIMRTEKDIKTLIYHSLKKEEDAHK